MPTYIALLRAVNVGGTGKLPMAELKALCEEEGYSNVETYIASGNVIFCSKLAAKTIKAALEARLERHMGKPVAVILRSAVEMVDVLQGTPFPHAPGKEVGVIFLDEAPPADAIDRIKGQQHEELRLGKREIYIHYTEGMGRSKLVIPAAKSGTMRNMNSVAKLVEMASARAP